MQGEAATETIADRVLSSVFGSVVLLVTLAIFVIVVPLVAPVSTLYEKRKTAVSPGLRLLKVQVLVPTPPDDGLLQVKLGPPVWVPKTKVVPVGTVSVSWTLAAASGPLFVMITSKLTSAPAVACGSFANFESTRFAVGVAGLLT